MNRLGLDKIIAATDAAFLLVTSIGTLLTTVPQDETFLRSASSENHLFEGCSNLQRRRAKACRFNEE